MTKSVISAPIWKPAPKEPVPIPEGADQLLSCKRASTKPKPIRPLNKKPALTTVNTTKPLQLLMMEGGMRLSMTSTYSGLRKERKVRAHFSHSFPRFSGRGAFMMEYIT
eukprot:Lithocolla_globosa_v1_NODE_4532_length_1415_cov_5.402206.p2 type:complete len:109 gc:universal NODE_4532_length_1415_cov_5.402206:1086-1412(+)